MESAAVYKSTSGNGRIVAGSLSAFNNSTRKYGDNINSICYLKAGKAYWIKCTEAGTLTITSNLGNQNTVPNFFNIIVKRGWNTFGISMDSKAEYSHNSINTSTGNIVPNTLAWFNKTIQGSGFYDFSSNLNNLHAGRGYWIKCTNNGNIKITPK